MNLKIEYNRKLCLLFATIFLIASVFCIYELLYAKLFENFALSIIVRILLGLLAIFTSFYFILFFITGIFLKYGVTINDGIVSLGMPLGGYVFKLDRIKSARIVMNNNLNAENIFIELYDEYDWVTQQKGWSRFWVKLSEKFFKSSIIISSYILKVNPHELVDLLSGASGEQNISMDQ